MLDHQPARPAASTAEPPAPTPSPSPSPSQPPGRNLVVCCDGTGNVWGNRYDTNVVELVRRAVKDESQIVYYDPGVGTVDRFPPVGPLEWLLFRLRLLAGLAFGGGVYENIAEAYRFLIHHWRPGDRIWLFGFSRGAFTARAVSGMVSLFGIVRPAADVMVPTLLRVYFSDPERRDVRGQQRADTAQDLRAHFADGPARDARVHFIGVWDTVATVGLLTRKHITSQADLGNKRFDHVRHAVSADENRRKYYPRLYDCTPRDAPACLTGTDAHGRTRTVALPSFAQLWFPGVHSDVGGGYARHGLSDIALQWMLQQAQDQGLRLLPGALRVAEPGDEGATAPGALRPLQPDPLACAHDQPLTRAFGPWWALLGLQRRQPPPPGQAHPSLRMREQQGAAQLWTPPWRHAAVRTPLVAAVLAGLTLIGLTAAVAPAAGSSALDLAGWQLLAPWRAAQRAPVYGGALGPLLAIDLLLIAAYTQLLCAGCAFTVRRLAGWRPADQGAHAALRVALVALLWAAPLADVAENALTLQVAAAPGSAWCWPLAAAAAIKWSALAGLLALLLWGALRGRSPPACPPRLP